MKKILFTLTLLSSSIALGQNSYVGPELGVNLIQTGNTDLGKTFELGWYAGGAYEYRFQNNFAIRSGVYFSQGKQRSQELDTNAIELLGGLVPDSMLQVPGIDLNTYTTINTNQTQHYIQIPVIASYTWKNLNVFGGGYAGIMVGAKRIDHIIEETPATSTLDLEGIGGPAGGLFSSFLPEPYVEETIVDNDREGLRLFDYGLKGGVGYTMDQFSLLVSYSFGLPDFRSDFEDEKRRHKFFQASIRYMIPLGKITGSSKI